MMKLQFMRVDLFGGTKSELPLASLATFGPVLDCSSLCSYVSAPMTDLCDASKRIYLPRAVQLLHALLREGHHVYVHCTAGIGRATATVCAFYHYCEGLPVETIFACVREQVGDCAMLL